MGVPVHRRLLESAQRPLIAKAAQHDRLDLRDVLGAVD
jgi:hypothetical protein